MVWTPVSSLGLCNSLYIWVDPFLDLKWILDERRLTMQFPFYAFAQPYLHFPSMSTAQSLVHLIWWRIYVSLRLAFISNGTSNRAEERKRSSGWWIKKRGEKYRWNRARCKSIKMKIIHLSRSVWQLEPPFDNVMHTIMHAQCEGH